MSEPLPHFVSTKPFDPAATEVANLLARNVRQLDKNSLASIRAIIVESEKRQR